MSDVITDREAITGLLTTGLAELDDLRNELQAAQRRRDDAQLDVDATADRYADKINDVLKTGWATPQALAAQGHQPPKRRTATGRAKTDTDTNPSDTQHAN